MGNLLDCEKQNSHDDQICQEYPRELKLKKCKSMKILRND